jgi:hypothetical protein
MCRNHLAYHLFSLRLKIGVLHILQAETARMVFFPDKNAHFIA